MRDALGSVQSLVVFGGTSEIGLAIARRLVADRTRRVVLAARDAAGAEAAGEPLRAEGADVAVVPFDAEDVDGHAAAVDAAFAAAGEVDVALVAFGLLGPQGDEQLAWAARLQRVNGAGAVSAMTHVAERMRAQGHGTIVLLSSVAADRPRTANFAYGASKAAADAYARGLADALHGTGVRVLVVRPGFVRTRMTAGMDPAPLSVDADRVAEAVAEALRGRELVVYVPAPLRFVMLVLRFLPRALLRRLPR